MATEDGKRWTVKKSISVIATSIAIVVGIVTLMTMVDNRYAKAETTTEIQQKTIQILKEFKVDMLKDRTQQQLLYNIQQQHFKVQMLEQRKWTLKDLMRKYPDDNDIKEEYNDIKDQLKLLKQKL